MLNDRAEVSCTAVAVQNSSEWPCPMGPFPQLRLVGVRTSYIQIFFLVLSGHLEFWTPLQIPIWGPPLGCTLLQIDTSPERTYGCCTCTRKDAQQQREVQIKTTMRYNCIPIRKTKIQNIGNTKCWSRYRATATFIHSL